MTAGRRCEKGVALSDDLEEAWARFVHETGVEATRDQVAYRFETALRESRSGPLVAYRSRREE